MRKTFRRFILIVLDPRPRWWASAWFLLLVGVPMFTVCNLAKPHFVQESRGGLMTVFKSPSGVFTLTDPPADSSSQRIELTWEDRLIEGRGYRRLERPWPVVLRVSPGTPPPSLTEIREIARMEGADLRDHALDPYVRDLGGLWASGRTEMTTRYWWYWPFACGWWVSIIVLCAAPVLWYLRATQAAWNRRRLERLGQQLCPECAYDLSASEVRRCPECGTDPLAVRQEVLKALRRR